MLDNLLASLRDEVTVELIRQRSLEYRSFFCQLELMSSVHRKEIETDPQLVKEFIKIFQEAIYSAVGLLASSDTREILVYARFGCQLLLSNEITYNEWLQRIWAVHYALRSDLGIIQPRWPSEIEKVRETVIAQNSKSIAELVRSTNHISYELETIANNTRKDRCS